MTSASYRVQVVVDLFKKHQIKHIVFSPGSRNASLVIGFNSDEFFENKVLVDERSAAFYALGIAQQTKQPVAICSTSGSAILNYSPAIAEAYYQKIPLVIVTADRPPEWIDHGEGQTIRQNKVYKNFVASSFNLPMLDHPDALWQTGVMTNEAINVAKLKSKPVHINFPFREPLYETVKSPSKKSRKITHFKVEKSLKSSQLAELSEIWNKSNKKMIICGSLPKNEILNKQLRKISEDDSVVILTESTSNLYDENFISCIDRTLERIYGKPSFIPDTVLTVGNSIISKKLKQLLRNYNPSNHWHIENTNRAQDVFSSLNYFIPIDPEDFFSQFIKNIKKINTSKFGLNWKKEFETSEKKHTRFFQDCNWSDLKAHFLIQKYVTKKNINFQMGNSSSVRYIQLFKTQKQITYNSNRGVSGIDGSSSTALGAAEVTNKLTLLITGDLSFIYDQNSLWNSSIPKNLKIIVINNQGGGIFNIIPGPKKTPYSEKHFETKHNLKLKNIARTFNINYQYAANELEADKHLKRILSSDETEILELFTANSENEKILFDYFKAIKN